jgi:hypothetical protein
MHAEGYSARRAAAILDRSDASIANQVMRLGLSKKSKKQKEMKPYVQAS